MKRKFILFTASLGIAYVTFSSYSSGPGFSGGLNRTGAPGTTGNCSGSGCHSGNTTATMMTMAMVVKGGSTPVTEYTPGTTYTVTIGGTNTSSLPGFGFQSCVEKKSDNSNTGTITATNPQTAVRTISGIKVIEHSSVLNAVSAGTYLVQFEWTAPAAGTGDIVFYGMLNAVNKSGNTAGDMPGEPIAVTFKEAAGSSVQEAGQVMISKLYPNPASSVLNVAIEQAVTGSYTLTVTDVTGKTVRTTTQQSTGSSFSSSINIADLAPGNYFLKVYNEKGQQVVSFVKK